jgi:hypothetical protein
MIISISVRLLDGRICCSVKGLPHVWLLNEVLEGRTITHGGKPSGNIF